jgi:hypothetical protein
VKLRTKKRLLNVASLLLLTAGGGTLWLAWNAGPPAAAADQDVKVVTAGNSAGAVEAAPVALQPDRWNRTLRRPLYDPPPPPKEEVVIPPRPITIRLVGTVMEGENSQAFIRQQNGQVEIKRLGDQITTEAADGVIATITASEIVIRREDGEHHVAVDGSR